MRREMKLRVWETEAKYMSTVAGLDWTMAGLKWYGPGVGDGWCWLDPDFDWKQKNCNPKPEYIDILMQYTGLKDKNGTEIYEGDIVHIWSPFYKKDKPAVGVFWNDTLARFDIKEHTGQYNNWLANGHKQGWYVEVIGNIHQNPDLVEEKA